MNECNLNKTCPLTPHNPPPCAPTADSHRWQCPDVPSCWCSLAPPEAILALVATVLVRKGGSALGGSGSGWKVCDSVIMCLCVLGNILRVMLLDQCAKSVNLEEGAQLVSLWEEQLT